MADCITGCGRPADGMCAVCWGRLTRDLGACAWLADELELVITGQVRYGGESIGVVVRSSEMRLPVNLRASASASALRTTLGLWARLLHEEHAPRWEVCAGCSARWYGGEKQHAAEDCGGTWSQERDALLVGNAVAELAGWLLRHPTWLRHHHAGDVAHREITDAVARAWSAIDRPADRIYLGICSAEPEAGQPVDAEPCEQEIYARPDREITRCRRCGAEHSLTYRREVMRKAAEDVLATATEISRAAPSLYDGRLNAGTIRQWAHRGKLVQHGANPPRYRIGDVLDLATRSGLGETSERVTA